MEDEASNGESCEDHVSLSCNSIVCVVVIVLGLQLNSCFILKFANQIFSIGASVDDACMVHMLAWLTPSSCTFSPISLLASLTLKSILFHFILSDIWLGNQLQALRLH